MYLSDFFFPSVIRPVTNRKHIRKSFHLKMLRLFCILLMMCLLVANAQPLSCKEDAHCSEGYFCATQVNICQECLKCQDLNRRPPTKDILSECIKTINRCGPCVEGFINIYGKGIKGKCVVPGLFEFGRGVHYVYLCLTAAVIGLLLVIAFMYVFKHTYVFRIVAYYHPVTGNTPATVTSVSNVASPQHLVKYLTHFSKNPSNK